jgi:Flp pilus assembly protein TadD
MLSANRQREGLPRPAISPRDVGSSGIGVFRAGPWHLLTLALLAALPYLGILANDFAYGYDDKVLILDSPYVRSFHHLRELFTTTLFSNMGLQAGIPYYRPMVKLGFLVCYQLFGPRPFGFHLFSLILNVAAVILLYFVAENLFGDHDLALAAAVLFALLPVHVEAVAWISAATDVEVTLFSLLAFWCFLRIPVLSGARRILAFMGMAVSFTFALLSKELAVTIPVLATIYEHFYRGDRQETSLRQKAIRYSPLWLILCGYLIVRVRLLGYIGHASGMHNIGVLETVFSALAILGGYCALLVFPVRLSAFHEFQTSSSFLEMPVLGGACVLVLCTWAFAVLWKRARPASFGLLWLFVALAPTLNARWMAAYVIGERFLFLPSVGFSLVAAWAFIALWRMYASRTRLGRTIVVGAGCLLAVLCVLRISVRVLDWRDDVTLFSRALSAAPNDFRLHDALGAAYWIRGNRDGAEREWQETLRLEPNSTDPISSLGVLYAQEGHFDRAIPLLEKMVRLAPNDADTHLNLGGAYAEMGDIHRAEEQFLAAVHLFPLNFNTHNLLGKLYFDSKRFPEAEQHFLQSLQCEPNLAAYDYLGYSYMQEGDRGRAEKAFKEALHLNSADSRAHLNLGKIYSASGNKNKAVQELHAALASDPGNAEIQAALEELRH